MRRSFFFSFLPFFLILSLVSTRSGVARFNWQTLESGMLKLHWYQGDATFGRSALEAAQAGLEAIGLLLPSKLEQPIDIYIYASTDDLHSELAPGGEDWVAGHADPALGVVKLVVEPGSEQGITMEQRIPHELMHVMLYRHVGAGYQNIPAWLREGMGTLVEMYPNAEYERVLRDAVTNDTLIPLQDLCSLFPSDTGQAFLAYAESRSFTRYLHETYGSRGVLELAAAYAEGVECDRGTERALGVSFSSLETQWRSSVLGERTFFSALQNISAYLVLLCLVLIIPLLGIAAALRKGKRNEPGTSIR